MVAVADAAEIAPLPPPASLRGVDDRVRAGVSGMMGKAGFFLAFRGDDQDGSRMCYWLAAEPR